MIRFGIITACRPRPTLHDSLSSLRRAGFDGHVVVSSDDSQLTLLDGCAVVTNPKPLGNLRNWHQCLTSLLTYSDDEWFCICEDDISWVVNCRAALEHDLRSLHISSRLRTVGMLSLYFPIAMSSIIEGDKPLGHGWHESTRGIKTWGAQCFMFTRAMAEDLIGNTTYRAYLADPKWKKNVDGIVADSIAKRDLRILYRVPCLVDHDLGEGNSSLGYADDRPKLKTRYYTGAAQ